MVYYMSVLHSDLPHAMSLLSNAVFRPAFLTNEVEEQRELIAYEKEDLLEKPEIAVSELLYATAYQDQPLGLSMIVPDENVHKMTSDLLFDYHGKLALHDLQ